MPILAKIGMVLLPGPIAAAESEHGFQQWEPEIRAFESADRTNPPPRNAVLFIGSSTIRLWSTLARDFPNHAVINRGFGGSQIADSTHFADRIIFPYRPRAVFLRAGGNDLWAGKPPDVVFRDFKDFVQTVHQRLPETEIAFIALCPSPARASRAPHEKQLNAQVRQFAQHPPKVRYVDAESLSVGPDGQPRPELFGNDRLHLNAEGYRLLAERVRPHLSTKPAL